MLVEVVNDKEFEERGGGGQTVSECFVLNRDATVKKERDERVKREKEQREQTGRGNKKWESFYTSGLK